MSSDRQLDPPTAFMMSVVGLGYLYVGKLRVGVAVLLGYLLFQIFLGWSHWIFTPQGIYLEFASLAIAGLLLWILPTIIAWKVKRAPVKIYNRWYVYVAWVVALSLCGEVLVPRLWQITGFKIFSTPTSSMEPTLAKGDWITVDTLHYQHDEPRLGEIVVFDSSDGYRFVKRIAGIPGDEIELRNAALFRNGHAVSEPYLNFQIPDRTFGRDVAKITLAPNEYFVLGDFRDSSRDSRVYGPISGDQLFGRVEMISFNFYGGRISWERFPKDLTDDT